MALRCLSRRLGGRALAPPLGKMKQDFGPNIVQREIQDGFSPRFEVLKSTHSHTNAKLAVEGSGGPTFVHKQRMTQLSTYAYSPVKKVAVEGSMQPCFVHNNRIPCPSGFSYSPLNKFGFSSRSFISSPTHRTPQHNSKVVMGCIPRPGFIGNRSKSTSSGSSSAPAEEYWFEIVGHRTQNINTPNLRFFHKRISGVSKEEARGMLRKFMWKVKTDGKVFPNGVPSLTIYQKLLLVNGKIKLVWFDYKSLFRSRFLMRFIGLELVLVFMFVSVYLGRPLSLIRRLWNFLKSGEEKKETEQKL